VLEDELKRLAFHDSLTGLPNRALFLDRVEHALQRRTLESEKLAVMLIDLDDFKLVNDTRGHATGDALLVAVGERLRSCLRAEDTAARLGGDEFAVLAEGLYGEEEARQFAERVLAALRAPYVVGDEPLASRASVGVATSMSASEAAELLRQADLAMYAAKDNGKGVCEFFHTSLEDRMTARIELRSDLERALERDEFFLQYQPMVELASGSVVGVEALIRWQHPTKGLVMPGQFIDAVEDTDLALPMGAWVLDRAIARAAAWHREIPASGQLYVSVNVAPRQLHDPEFVGMVAGALTRHRFPAGSLTLEITERLLAGEDPQAVTAMTELRALGVALALDDFGTGYSALGYLRRFPVDVLKIDRSFVTGIERSPDDRALVEAIVRLGETFGLGLVAEGIETEGQREALVTIGCGMGQGYLFSKPLPEADLTALLLAQARRVNRGGPCSSAA
jgi:diguanylate cyclase (GGDEF)-like protein